MQTIVGKNNKLKMNNVAVGRGNVGLASDNYHRRRVYARLTYTQTQQL